MLNKDLASKSISSQNVNGIIMTGKSELSEALNHHFVSVVPKLGEKNETTANDTLFKLEAKTLPEI